MFKAHPGVRTVIVSDHAGMAAVLDAAPEVLDREQNIGFGCVSLFHEHVLEGVVPALVSTTGAHAPARALVDRAMALRGDAALSAACQGVLDGGWPSLRGRDRASFEEALVETAVHIAFRWFFDLEGPAGKDHLAWLRGSFGLHTDTALTNWIARLAKPPPNQAVRGYSATQLGRIRGSEPHAAFVEIARELGLDPAVVAPHLMFAAAFNAAGGTYTTAFPALGTLHALPELRAEVAAELEGFSGGVDELDALPLLDALLYETMRHYGRPRQYYRHALRDTEIPTSDGRRIPVPAGSAVGLVAVSARQDPTVFEQPERFRPQRFLERSELEAAVRAFGPAAESPSPYACAGAANGSAPRLWKTVVASLARHTDWRLDPPPRPDLDAPTGLDPDALTWLRR